MIAAQTITDLGPTRAVGSHVLQQLTSQTLEQVIGDLFTGHGLQFPNCLVQLGAIVSIDPVPNDA